MVIQAINWINKRLKVKILTLIYRIPHTLLSLTSFLVSPTNPLSSRQAGPCYSSNRLSPQSLCTWWFLCLKCSSLKGSPSWSHGTPHPTHQYSPFSHSLLLSTEWVTVWHYMFAHLSSLNPNGMQMLQRQGLCFVFCCFTRIVFGPKLVLSKHLLLKGLWISWYAKLGEYVYTCYKEIPT